MLMRRWGLLVLVAVACSSRSPDDTPAEGEAGAASDAGAGGDATAHGAGGTHAGAPERGGTAGNVGMAEGGSGHASGGKAGSSGSSNTDAGGSDGIAAGGMDGGTGGASIEDDPCSDGGEGGACPVQRDPTCVIDCSSIERTPAILDADGSWRCPDSAPMRAEECHIDCPALYDAADDEENAYVCGAGALCTPRGVYAYLESCTEPFTEYILLDASCRCQRVPTVCPTDADLTRPACGADGKSYANECEMWQARMNRPGESAFCPDDRPGFFHCEHTYCLQGQEICVSPYVVDDHHFTGGDCIESSCAASGGCECLVAELGESDSPAEYSPGPVPKGYEYCSDTADGRVHLR
jgi:hypothetical protein